jgi:hypothetical protein
MKRLLISLIGLTIFNMVLMPAAFAGAVRNDTLPSAAEVIQRYIDALGGRAAIESLTTRICVGRVIHDLNWASPPYEVIPFAAYAAAPNQVLMVEHKAGGIRCEGCDGEVTWVQDATGVTLKDEPFWSKMAWLIDPQNALRIGEYFPGLEVASERALDDRWVFVVESPELDPAYYALAFDVETGILLGVGYYWHLQDYREVDGVRFPHRVIMSRKGGSSTFVFDLVAHNLPLEQTLFAIPTSVR